VKKLRLVQLPVPPPAALASTGNVPLAAGCLGVSARVHGLTSGLELDVVPPATTDALGDTLLADELAADEPDFLGFSLYLWNTERSLHLAREVKRRSPRTRVLVGGPEVSGDNPFVLGQKGFDIAVTGEAEDTFGPLMRALLDGRSPAGLPGVAVRGPLGLSAFGPAPNAGFELAQYPSPYLEGLVPVEAHRSTYIETVRGCRSHCTFCFYPRSSSVLRVLDVERSAQLVSGLRERGAREVVFLDPTFNHRPELEPLLDALADVNSDRSVSFFGEIRAEGLTPQHAAKLAKAGFDKLEIGLQSVNRGTLKRVRRGGSPALVAEAAKMLHDHGIQLLVDLIIGLPGDTPDDVARGMDFLYEHGLAGEAQVFPLSLLPGTAMRSTAAEDGVVFDPAPPYRVLRTADFSQEQLLSSLLAAEERLGRRLDEWPRPHLVDGTGPSRVIDGTGPSRVIDGTGPSRVIDGTGPSRVIGASGSDVFRVGGPQVAGAQHVALWFTGSDLFGRRGELSRAIDARLSVDPFATLDVVLCPDEPFPLDLLDTTRAQLQRAVPSYVSRAAAHRGEDLQRRIAVVLRGEFPRDWIELVRERAQVFVERPLADALERAERLGNEEPFARVVGEVDAARVAELAKRADPDAVVFAQREDEARWQRDVVF
jgi:hypothetical protein